MLVELDDDVPCGPAMRRLTPLQRNFVRLYVDFPRRAKWRLVKAAGFQNSDGGHRVTAHRLVRDLKVLAAIAEETMRRAPLDAALSRAILLEIASSKKNPQRLKAAAALGDRTGFAAEQKHVVEHRDESAENKLVRIAQLAALLGIDPATLLGGNVGPFPVKQIEAVPERSGE
jgi:hypothetical protein